MNLLSAVVFLSICTLGLSETGPSSKIKVQKRSFLSAQRSLSGDELLGQRSRFLNKNRSELIIELRGVLKTLKDPVQVQELELRLANLYIEEFKSQSEKGQGGDSYLRKAQGILSGLAKRTPPCSRPDEVLFLLAQTFIELHETTRALELFNELTRAFPSSPYLEEAYLQLGDGAFEKGDFIPALSYFEKLTKNPQSSLYLYAHYKSGWADFNLKRLDSSVNHFKTIIEQDDLESRSLALKKEAVRDLCYPIAELKQFDEGLRFYSQQEPMFFRLGVECLASAANNQGETAHAVKLYQALLDIDSHHKENPTYSLSILEAERKMGKPQQLILSLTESLDHYQGNSTWKEIFSSDPVFFKEVTARFEAFTRTSSLELHSLAQKTKNPVLYEHAKLFYELYLKHFFSLDAPKIQFYLAEIYFKQNKFKDAALAYSTIFDQSQVGPEMKEQALEYAVLASSKDLDLEMKKGESEALSQAEMAFLKLADQFTTAFPKNPQTPDISFRSNHLQYSRGDHKTAYVGFWNIVDKYPHHAVATKASKLILDILNKRSDYPNLIAACKKLRSLSFVKSTPLFNEIGGVLRKAELKQIALLEESEEFLKAGKEYLKYVDTYGSEDSALLEKALYNAGICFYKAHQLSEALKTQERFLKAYPSSPFRKELLLQVAKAYEAMAELGQAAHYFSLFQAENPGHKDSPEALRLAGLYFWANSDLQIAEKTMLRAMQTYPSLHERLERDLLELYSSEGWWEKQNTYLIGARLTRGISFSHYLELTLELIEIQERHLNKNTASLWSDAEKTVEKYRNAIQSNSKGPELIGRVLLNKAFRKQKEFDSIRLLSAESVLEKNLAKKIKLLNELEHDLAEVVSLGGESGLAALYSITQSHLSLSAEIESAPIPRELSGEQLDIYRDELFKQMVTPLNKKALAFVNQCIEKDQEFALLSEWGLKCRETAYSLQSEPTAKTQRLSLPPYYLSWVIPPSTEESQNLRFIQSSPLFKGGAEERREYLASEVDGEIVQDQKGYLATFNALRFSNPNRAIQRIKQHLKNKDQDPLFHHLLAFSYVDNGELIKAKITWLSLLARGLNDGAIFNNLAVVEALRGNKKVALELFSQASALGNTEASINQGFIALAQGNKLLASSLFEKSLEPSSDELAQIGKTVAELQLDENVNGKSKWDEIQRRFPSLSWIGQPCFNCLAEKKSDR